METKSSRTLAEAEAEIASLRETNAKLHRRVQQAESGALKDPFVKDYWRVSNELAFYHAEEGRRSERLTKTFATFKRIFEAAAVVLDLPHERYHSVMDWSFKDTVYRFKPTDNEPGLIYANVYLTKMGGVVSYDVAEVVEEAFATLRQNLVNATDDRASRGWLARLMGLLPSPPRPPPCLKEGFEP